MYFDEDLIKLFCMQIVKSFSFSFSFPQISFGFLAEWFEKQTVYHKFCRIISKMSDI